MGRLEDDVRELILEDNRSLASFARKIGIPEHTLYSALTNGLIGATFLTVRPIVNELNLDWDEFAQGRAVVRTKEARSALVPLFGSIAAGSPLEMDAADDVFPIPVGLHREFPDAFMLRVQGTSMNRILPDGWLVLIDPCNDADLPGEMYAIAVGEDAATIKHVRKLANGLELRPNSDDPTHHSLIFDYANEGEPEIRVIGRVIWWCPPPQVASH